MGKQPDRLLLLMEKAGSGPQCDAEISGAEPTWAVLHGISKACMSEFCGTGATEA